ncbi:polysaccharide biosynthesis protein, partial [Acinetobacter baumannii]
GSELALRSAEIGASRVLVIDPSEAALHAVLERAELTLEGKAEAVEGRLCDSRDRARIAELIRGFAPDVVFHAAALKHVPHLEREVAEAVRT